MDETIEISPVTQCTDIKQPSFKEPTSQGSVSKGKMGHIVVRQAPAPRDDANSIALLAETSLIVTGVASIVHGVDTLNGLVIFGGITCALTGMFIGYVNNHREQAGNILRKLTG